MTMRLVRTALGGLVLTCSACVVAPSPAPMAVTQNCRPFTQTITVDGKSQPGYGVECQQPDGTWTVVTPATATPPPPPVAAVPVPGYVYEPPYYYYWYLDSYPWAYYPWYFGPDIAIGVGPGYGWHGGWEGGWHDGGAHGRR